MLSVDHLCCQNKHSKGVIALYIIASILMIAGIAVMFMNIDSYGLFLGILIVAAGFLCGFIANKMAQAKVQREKDAEAEQARRKAGQLLTQLENKTWKFPVNAFKDKCAALNVNDISSAANTQRAKLIATEVLKSENIPERFHDYYTSKEQLAVYFQEINREKEKKAEVELWEKQHKVRQEESALSAECTRFANYFGQEKSIRICENKIAYYNRIIRECESEEARIRKGGHDLNTLSKQKEHDWAVHGGIASGIAGPAAGLATAIDIQRKNEAIRQHNDNITTAVAALTLSSLEAVWERKSSAKSSLGYWTEKLEEAKLLLIEERDEKDLLARLKPSVKKYETSVTGAVKIQVQVQATQNLYIYEDVPAVIDGSIQVQLQHNNKVVGTAICTIDYNGTTTNQTLSCICVKPSEKSNAYTFKFVPNHLWAVEKK